jgi:hypothetical protein
MTVNLFGVTSKPGNRTTLVCHPLRKKAHIPATVYKRQTSYYNSSSQSLLRNNETLPDVESKIIQHPLKNIIIDTNGVTKLLKNLNTSKANGSDAIPNSILKGCAEQLSPGLSAVFQLSLDSGSLHIDWLKGNISSVFKKGDKHLSENYRPISLTCISCKILEHIICRHLMKHLEDNNILTTLNHGFRSGYSCESQLIVTMDDLLQAYDKNTQVDCAILDFSKAFDTVLHKKLLHKLTAYGINGPIHAWLTQFLTARTMQVVLEGQTTNQVTVDSGVPQGTASSHKPAYLRMIVCSTMRLKPNKITSLFNKTSNIWKTGHNPGE